MNDIKLLDLNKGYPGCGSCLYRQEPWVCDLCEAESEWEPEEGDEPDYDEEFDEMEQAA